jgi:cytochrome c oxidase assembly factor CtaG
MDSTVNGLPIAWPFDPWLIADLALTAVLYLRGWLSLPRRAGGRWNRRQPAAFLGGLAALFLALGSPIDSLAGWLLQVHMVQHLLLIMVVPPLLWLGDPLIPLLRGLPRPFRSICVAPLFRSRILVGTFTFLTHPMSALVLFTAVNWIWHSPPAYEIALRSGGWHYVEHICFLLSGMVFWFPVVRPFPSRPSWSPWLVFPCLILADVQNTVLAALLTFSNRVLYPYYEQMPRLYGISALDDQSTAGVIMWVPGSIVYLLPLFVMGLRQLSGTASHTRTVGARSHPMVPMK